MRAEAYVLPPWLNVVEKSIYGEYEGEDVGVGGFRQRGEGGSKREGSGKRGE